MKEKHRFKTYYLVIVTILYISACSNSQTLKNTYKGLICNNASAHEGQVIGDGHCVSLIKYCSNAPNTDQWLPGEKVWKNRIQPGAIIATFKNGRYPNISGYHAAIFIKQDSDGIWVWDQWQGKSVHKRLIRWRNDGSANSNKAQSYRTVLTSSY